MYCDKAILDPRFDVPNKILRNLSEDPTFKASEYFDKFASLETNLDRINFVYQNFEKFEAYPPLISDNKDDLLAGTARETGNGHFGRGEFRKALDCYTRSIQTANTKEVMALGFGNRSAALLKLGFYAECLTDINRALKNEYPDKLKFKLLARQNFCKGQTIVENNAYDPVPTFPAFEKNASIQCARNCIEIMQNERYGRHVVATRNIEMGEILAIEKPYASIVTDSVSVYCHECLKLCYNMIPCDKCTKALYCSDNCKDKAYESYHKYECPIHLSLDPLLIDSSKRLALRIALISRNEWAGSLLNESPDEMYCSDRFKEVFNLDQNVRQRFTHDLFGRTTIACGVFYLIKKYTTFLQEYDEDRFKEILLSLLLICSTNTVRVNEVSSTLGEYDVCGFACSHYPFFSMFNHSCWPNVCRSYHGSQMVLRAIRTIKKGEQCFVTYGPSYLSDNIVGRQAFLFFHYFFNCGCKACVESWPKKSIVDMFIKSCREQGENFFCALLRRKLVREADADVARKHIPSLLVKAKFEELYLPPAEDFFVNDTLDFCYSVLACGVFYLIKKYTTFLQEYDDGDRFKEILLSLLLICSTNTVRVNEVSSTLGEYDVCGFASSHYPFFSMFNHSCWPNVCRSYHGSQMVLRAIRTIKKGEQCFVTYGPSYLSENIVGRQAFLFFHYFFNCGCKACVESWPKKSIVDMFIKSCREQGENFFCALLRRKLNLKNCTFRLLRISS
ncbi:SET and MYND domain-containing protein 4-like Protein [Tribolium castaneum]|uniref:SET and MYND domain-containing protein 4-like Protein n=1 Tax=Tribolium castaneum TaxID=7070 RepID=A0A139WK24_TRICA|nr:SET and MYND domain-containing protein 4-like Protein [Tribolium castaneum]